jgi:prepilin-type N-terminal cleavage/methylation domain-containing protein
MKRKGFTLIELLAVIVILAIIALIVTPMIVGTINSAKQNAAKASALNYIDAVEQYAMAESAKGNTIESKTYTVAELSAVGVNGKKPISKTVTIANNIVTDFDLIIDGYEIKRTGADGEVTVTEVGNTPTTTTYTDSVLNGADPVLDVGMIPVTIDDDGTVKKADLTTAWYDYTNKKWANVVVVISTSRSTYQSAAAKTPITASDILGYYVWIPRYSYKLFNAAGYSGTTPSTIEITFENKNTTKSTGTANGDKLTHPAFTFGTTELNGFWVGKFELTGNTTTITVLPNVTSSMNQDVSTFFSTISKFKTDTYGITSDSHMIMNKEWGAVTYLTQSIYGKNSEVRLNNNSNFTTGCGALTANANYTANCDNAYGTVIEYPQSTTGNISGIYDMSGGALEVVMGVLLDSNGNPRSGNSSLHNSGYNGMYYNGTLKTDGLAFPDFKYYQAYTTLATSPLGDALKETWSWYNDYPDFANSNDPWFVRGDNCCGTWNSGIFASDSTDGHAYTGISSRVVIAPGA